MTPVRHGHFDQAALVRVGIAATHTGNSTSGRQFLDTTPGDEECAAMGQATADPGMPEPHQPPLPLAERAAMRYDDARDGLLPAP